MTSRTRNGLILAALLVLAGGALLIHQVRSERQLEKFQQTFPIMGTLAGFTFYAEPEQSAAAAEAARAAFDRVTELANLNETTLQEAWNNEKYRDLREKIRHGRHHYDFCKYCDFIDAGLRSEITEQ